MGSASFSPTAIFRDAGEQSAYVSKTNKEIIEHFPAMLVATKQFSGFRMVDEQFRKDKPGSEAEIALQSKGPDGRAVTTSIVLYSDGNITIGQSSFNPVGGQNNQSAHPWNYSAGGWKADVIMREIALRIGSINPGFREFLDKALKGEVTLEPVPAVK